MNQKERDDAICILNQKRKSQMAQEDSQWREKREATHNALVNAIADYNARIKEITELHQSLLGKAQGFEDNAERREARTQIGALKLEKGSVYNDYQQNKSKLKAELARLSREHLEKVMYINGAYEQGKASIDSVWHNSMVS